MEKSKTKKVTLDTLVEFWMDLSRHKALQEYIQEWLKPRMPPLFEEITKKRKEITLFEHAR